MVGVAQLVEHQVVVLGVAGSSPVAHPIESAGQEALAGRREDLQVFRHSARFRLINVVFDIFCYVPANGGLL